MNLLDLLPPFNPGDRVTDPTGTFTHPRTWTVTTITDEDHQWRLDAKGAKTKGGRVAAITYRWPKDQPPRLKVAA